MRAIRPVLFLSLSLLTTTLACGKLKSDADAGTPGAAGTNGAAGTGAAGTGGAGMGGRTLVTISGTAAPHPLNAALGATEDFSQLKVSIVDPAVVLTNPSAPPAASMTLDTTTAGNCDATSGCKWSLSGVDITNITLGLVGTLEDKRTADARLWLKTGTGMGTGNFLKAVRAAPAPITDRRAFAVSRKLEAKLVAFVNKVLGLTLVAGDLEARGFLIGHVVGKLSEGHPDPEGVAGATVVPGGTSASAFDLIYPNADFSGKGASTAASGIFLMVPKTTASVVTTWDVVPPSGDARTWPQHLAGSNPGNAFVIILPANE
jgi:hypothetical protein